MKRSPYLAVEPADAAESCRRCDLLTREHRLVEQLLGEVSPARERNLEGRRAKVLREQAAQMPGRQPDAFAQAFDTGIVEDAVANQPERARDDA
jgi:hypothetical protein